MPQATIGSTCTGTAALDGAVAAIFGARLAWVAENADGPARFLGHRFPAAPNLGDLTAVDWAAVPWVDIMTAGFPCSPVSNAGRRKGHADERWIWPGIARAIRLVRPRFVVLENVSALLVRGFDAVKGDLAALGYLCAWTCLRASAVGAPHKRDRLFLVGWLAAAADASGGELQRGGGPRILAGQAREVAGPGVQRERDGHPAGGGGRAAAADPDGGRLARLAEHHGREAARIERRDDAAGRAAAGAAAADPDGARRGHAEDASAAGRPAGPAAEAGERGAAGPGEPERAGGPAAPAADADGEGRGLDGEGGGPGPLPGAEIAARATIQPGRRRGGDPPALAVDWQEYAPAIERWETILGRPAPCPVRPARVSRRRVRACAAALGLDGWAAAEMVRRGWYGAQLAPEFSEWMQGFPEGWVCDVPGLSRADKLHMIGNSVVPAQAAAGIEACLDDLAWYAARMFPEPEPEPEIAGVA